MDYSWGVTCILQPRLVSGIYGITSDDKGNIYFTDARCHVWIWNKNANQNPDAFITVDGEDFRGITWDGKDNLYVSARKPSLEVWPIVSREPQLLLQRKNKGYANGTFDKAAIREPWGLCRDRNDNHILYFTDEYRIRRIDLKSRKIDTICGHKSRQYDGFNDGTLEDAEFFSPHGITSDKDGAIYIADPGCHNIRKVKDGMVTTFRNDDTVKSQCPVSTFPQYGFWASAVDVLNDQWLVSCESYGYVRMHNLNNSMTRTLYLPELKSQSLSSLHIDMDGTIFVGTVYNVYQIENHWKWQRTIWIGHKKENASDCLLAKLPRELIRHILCQVIIPVKTYTHRVPEPNFNHPNAKKKKPHPS